MENSITPAERRYKFIETFSEDATIGYLENKGFSRLQLSGWQKGGSVLFVFPDTFRSDRRISPVQLPDKREMLPSFCIVRHPLNIEFNVNKTRLILENDGKPVDYYAITQAGEVVYLETSFNRRVKDAEPYFLTPECTLVGPLDLFSEPEERREKP